ncbi:MAG: type I methionyl aminopeptidase [Bacteroidaceae bacterium]|nr:type I methionyl aminopeptidase [Bacteroidaceae bacterium]
MPVFLKTEDEIALMRRAGDLVGQTLGELSHHIRPGVTTRQLDTIAETFIRDHGATPSFKHYPNPKGAPFPASICTSVNDTIVHGIPSDDDVLHEGDIISIDCGACLDGFHGDSCYTFAVGEVSDATHQLLTTTLQALHKGISVAVAGGHLSDIGHAIQHCCEPKGYSIVRELTGHGIGRQMHEAPLVPNYGAQGQGIMLKEGMCIAIDPMIVEGQRYISILPDYWTVRTRDGRRAAHYEHTIAIRRGQPEVLTTFDYIAPTQQC